MGRRLLRLRSLRKQCRECPKHGCRSLGVLLHHLLEEHDLLELGLFELALEICVLFHFLVEHDCDLINLLE